MKEYILAHDLGTSGNKATLFSTDGCLIGSMTASYPVYYDQTLYAEQNAEDWWQAVCSSTKRLMAEYGVDPADIKAVSFSGQMMGCLPVDKTGKALRRSIIWADQRSKKEAARLAEKIEDAHFYHISGHRNTPSYGIQKIMWLMRHEPEIYSSTYKFLNAKDYIVCRLTGKFYTDYSDANSMGCFDLAGLKWSDEIIAASGIDGDKLPEIVPSTKLIGTLTKEASEETGLACETKVVMGAGDGVAANVGAGSIAPGKAYCCLGTSAWVAATSEKPIFDEERRIVCWAHAVPGLYSPNGTMQYAGGSYQWMNKVLCKEENLLAEREGKTSYELINGEIESCEKGADGVIFLPYLMGERAPRWNPDATGAFFGLKESTTKEQMLRSVLEGIVMNLGICFDILQREVPISEILLIGGAARSHAWQTTAADIFDTTVLVPQYLEEANSMGAAVIAGVGCGIYSDFTAIDRFVRNTEQIEPDPEARKIYAPIREKYENLYQALKPLF